MATSPKTQQVPSSKQEASGSKREKGIYVYGILPPDIELTADMPAIQVAGLSCHRAPVSHP